MNSAIRPLSLVDRADPGAPRHLWLPPAGGTLSGFRELAAARPGLRTWGVEYAGRGDRAAVPRPGSLEELAEQVTYEFLVRFGPAGVARTIVSGFSMGAFVAVEVAQRVHAWCGTAPAAVVVVGAPAPGRRVRGRYARIAEDALAELLAGQGFVAGAGNRASFELWAYARELLRGDLRLMDAYRGPGRTSVPCPLAALCGADDPGLVAGDATEAWRACASGPFFASTVPGGHLGLLEPGQGHQFWASMDRLERAIPVRGTRDA